MKRSFLVSVIVGGAGLLLLAACGGSDPTPTLTQQPAATATPTLAPSATSTSVPGPTDSPVILTPVQDNTLFEDLTPLSNGSGEHLFAGNTSRGSARRALMQFDVAGGVPAGAKCLRTPTTGALW